MADPLLFSLVTASASLASPSPSPGVSLRVNWHPSSSVIGLSPVSYAQGLPSIFWETWTLDEEDKRILVQRHLGEPGSLSKIPESERKNGRA